MRLKIKYDKEEDILYVYFSKNRPAITIELENDILLRIDPESKKIISLEILFFKKFIKELIYRDGGWK